VGEAIAGQLGRVGVRAKLNVQDSAAIFSAHSAKKLQMYLFAWKSSPEAGRHIETLLHSKTRGYYYQNPEADKLIEAYLSALEAGLHHGSMVAHDLPRRGDHAHRARDQLRGRLAARSA